MAALFLFKNESKEQNKKMAVRSRSSTGGIISTIFFDLDNTLIPTRKADRIACHKVQNLLVEKYGFSVKAASNATQWFLKNFRKCPENVEYSLDVWRIQLWMKSLGETHADIAGDVYRQWLNFRYKYLSPTPEVVSLLESLHKKYYLAVITNGPSDSQWEKIGRLQLSQYFHLILVSGDLKTEKPNEKIFLEGCVHLGVSPEECIMVGDKLETDILGGINAGLGGTVWVPATEILFLKKESGDNSLKFDVVPDCIIGDVTQLKVVLSHEKKFYDFKMKKSSRFFDFIDPEVEDCNSNSSDGS